MKRLACLTLIAVFCFGALAYAEQTTPGTPGDANCEGQTIAYLAQAFGVVDVHGIGGLAAAVGVSVKDIKAIVDGYCNP